MKIGLISDTHIPAAGQELPDQVAQAFVGVDLILHAGDICMLKVLDWLERIAPVRAVRGNEDVRLGLEEDMPVDPRLKDAQVLEIGGLRVGLIHDLLAVEYPSVSLEDGVRKRFQGPVDVLVHGHTHVEQVEQRAGVLLVNPGSPTFPHNMVRLGTVGLLGINDGVAEATIVRLDRIAL